MKRDMKDDMKQSNGTAEVIVALGSNLGDSQQYIRLAIKAISAFALDQVAVSAMWRSEPKNMNDDSGEFINACIGFETALEPLALLRALQGIEVSLGRPSVHGKNVQRTIDLDIVDYDATVLQLPDLVVPHPRMLERLFVLLPLREVCPNFRDPHSNRSIDDLIAAAPDMKLTRQ